MHYIYVVVFLKSLLYRRSPLDTCQRHVHNEKRYVIQKLFFLKNIWKFKIKYVFLQPLLFKAYAI